MVSSPQPSSTPAVANTPPAPYSNPPAMIQPPSAFSYNVSQFRADTPTLAQQPSAPSSISNSTMALSSSPNVGVSTSHAAMTPFFAAHSGLPGTPQMNLSAVNTVLSSVQRPTIQTSALAPNPVQQQNFHAYPSVPGMAAPPHGLWYQPPPRGGVPRGPFLPYPAAFPGPFTSPVPGYSRPSIASPDHQHPGATPAGIAGANPPLSSASVHPLTVSPGMQRDLPPPGIENKSHSHVFASKDNTAIDDSSDSWTAHKTDAGVVYYYNSVTGVSTYQKPPGFNGETEKISVQRTPVSMENVVGTDWALIITNDGKKYYYNNKTKLSSWQIPSEVAELKKKQEAEVKEQELPGPISSDLNEKGSLPVSLSAPAISTGGRDSIALRPSATPGAASALDLIKRKLQDSGSPVSSSPAPISSGITAIESNGSRTTEDTAKSLPNESSKERLKDANGAANASESSSDSEEDDSGPTKEECIIQFKEMLKERGIPPFAKWKEELPKIVFDPRFKAIPSHSTRRSLFEHYVKTRAEEERKEKRAAQRLAIDGFRQLLEEASEEINNNTDYQSFRKKWGNDPRFVAVDRKDREPLLNERSA